MITVYHLKYKENVVGIFVEVSGDVVYIPNRTEADKLPRMIGYPPGLYNSVEAIEDSFVDSETVHRWAKNRVASRSIKGSPWEVLKKYNGMSDEDRYRIE